MPPKTNSPSALGIEMSKAWTLAGMPFPVNPTLLSLEISKQRFDDKVAYVKGHTASGIDGMLIKSSSANEWFILYDETVQVPGRVNFTIAHEFGHYLLHRNDETNFQCSQSKILGYDNSAFEIEKEANQFASYLLMPIDDFRNQIGSNKISLDLLGHCADRYSVSMTAALLKWIQFTSEVAIAVLSRDGFILWSYPSASAKKLRIFYPKGTELPQVTQDRISINSDFKIKVKRSVGVWNQEHECNEEIIVSDKYETELILLTFPFASSVDFEEEYQSDTLDFMQRKSI